MNKNAKNIFVVAFIVVISIIFIVNIIIKQVRRKEPAALKIEKSDSMTQAPAKEKYTSESEAQEQVGEEEKQELPLSPLEPLLE